jgi:hypothetical protein
MMTGRQLLTTPRAAAGADSVEKSHEFAGVFCYERPLIQGGAP